ncbi:MAG: hypothetical protein HOP36_09325, partial [Methyloglobulus sp.]|nr:hypothetical protein [Methyloglobulus sp.]
MRLLSILTIGVLWTCQVIAAQKPSIPNVNLQVTVQQKENGIIATDWYHILHLQCFDGSCSLTSTSLNQCKESYTGNKVFYPKVERSSTVEGNLTVTSVRDGELEVHESDVLVKSTYLFSFEPTSNSIADNLTGFSGGFVKNSIIAEKVLTVEYIPLKKRFIEVKLDCSVLLPGLSEP